MGLLTGVVVGGAGVSLASTTPNVVFCVHKKTAIVRQPKSGRCARTETRLAMNSTGPAGATGPQGPAGAQGPQGVAGTQGPAGAQGIQGTPGAQGATGPSGASGEAGNQWSLLVSASGSASTSQSSRQQAQPFPLQEDTADQFTFECWVQAGTTPSYAINYMVNSGEQVIATAFPLGGSGSVATWIVTSPGLQDLGTVRTTSDRWLIEVRRSSPNETTTAYEIVAQISPLQGGFTSCNVSFSKRG